MNCRIPHEQTRVRQNKRDRANADIFVTRRGAFGGNRTLTRAQIVAGAGVVPDPLLLNDGSATDPTYSFSSNPTTGVFLLGSNQLAFAANGIGQWVINPTELSAFVSGGPLLRNFDSTATIPNIISDSGDTNTGWGSAGPDILSGIAGGVEGIRVTEVAGNITVNLFGPTLAPDGTFGAPSYSFASASDLGIFKATANVLGFSAAGTAEYKLTTGLFQGNLVGSGVIRNAISSSTLPTICPSTDDLNTGLGHATADQLNAIAGGLTCMSIRNTAGARQVGFYDGVPISLQTGVAVTTAAIHAALVALRLFTA